MAPLDTLCRGECECGRAGGKAGSALVVETPRRPSRTVALRPLSPSPPPPPPTASLYSFEPPTIPAASPAPLPLCIATPPQYGAATWEHRWIDSSEGRSCTPPRGRSRLAVGVQCPALCLDLFTDSASRCSRGQSPSLWSRGGAGRGIPPPRCGCQVVF